MKPKPAYRHGGLLTQLTHLSSLENHWDTEFQNPVLLDPWKKSYKESWHKGWDTTQEWATEVQCFSLGKFPLTPTCVKTLEQRQLWKISIFNCPQNVSLGFSLFLRRLIHSQAHIFICLSPSLFLCLDRGFLLHYLIPVLKFFSMREMPWTWEVWVRFRTDFPVPEIAFSHSGLNPQLLRGSSSISCRTSGFQEHLNGTGRMWASSVLNFQDPKEPKWVEWEVVDFFSTLSLMSFPLYISHWLGEPFIAGMGPLAINP